MTDSLPRCVDARDPKKIFETFYRSDHGGLGIGLATSRSIELSHGGTLAAERRHSTGYRFSLNLRVRRWED